MVSEMTWLQSTEHSAKPLATVWKIQRVAPLVFAHCDSPQVVHATSGSGTKLSCDGPGHGLSVVRGIWADRKFNEIKTKFRVVLGHAFEDSKLSIGVLEGGYSSFCKLCVQLLK
jgi:hypothetical protein